MAFRASSNLSDAGLRIQLGTVLELSEEYREREQRAAAFQDRVRERIAESGLPIYALDDAVRPVYSDQVMLNYLTLRGAEESAAVQIAQRLSASIERAIDSLAAR